MALIENAIFIAIACLTTLSIVLFFLYTKYRELSMLVWAVNATFSIAGYIIDLNSVETLSQGIVNPFFFVVTLPSTLTIIKGMTLYLGKKMQKFWFIITPFLIAWLIIGVLLPGDDTLLYALISLDYVIVYTYVGINFLRSRGEKDVGTIITGTSCIGFAFITFMFPFSAVTPDYVANNTLILSVLTITISVGLLLIYFEKNMSLLIKNEKDLLQAKKAAEAANDAKSEFLSLMSDALLIVDLEGKIITGNLAAYTLFQYTETDLIGKPIQFLIDPASFKSDLPDFSKENLLKRESIQDIETVANSKSGKKIPVSLSKKKLFDQERNRQLNIYIFCDRTDKMRAKENLRLLEKLNETNELKTKIITWAAHELKTPLTPIVGYVDLLYNSVKNKKENLGDFNLEDCEILLQSTQRLAKIVDNFLDVGRLQDGNYLLRREKVDLNRLILDAMKIIQFQASQKKIEVKTENLPVIANIDKGRMEHVILNLLSNAVKYSPENTKIAIKIDQIKDGDKDVARITVTDQGFGFTPEEIEHAFLPFAKVYTIQDQKKFITGTGLGLYISQNIVESHGGTIQIHSDGINKGTQAVVTFPIT